MNNLVRAWTVLLAVLALPAVGVADDKLVDLSCEQLFERGKERYDAGKERDARKYLTRYEQRCPREPMIEEAKVLIARSFFAESAPDLKIEGIARCRRVISFYPNDPAACECQLLIGDYHFARMRPADRDQTETERAVEEYQRVLGNYPDCGFVEQARERLHEAYDRLASQELVVGEYYLKSKKYKAASMRFGYLMANFPEFSQRCYALRRYIDTLARMNDFDTGRTVFARMSEDCPDDPELARAREMLGVAPPVDVTIGANSQ